MEMNDPKASSSPINQVDLNSISLRRLVQVPGIGRATARRILDGRPYASIDDLLHIEGMDEAALEKIKPYFSAMLLLTKKKTNLQQQNPL